MRFDFSQNQSTKAAKPLLPVGVYSFEISSALADISKAGKPTIKLTLNVKDATGKKHEVVDYLSAGYAVKIKELCQATGLDRLLHTNEINASDFKDARGLCVVFIKAGDGTYPDKNEIKSYLRPRPGQEPEPDVKEPAAGSPDNGKDL
jgi:hypothetical protein